MINDKPNRPVTPHSILVEGLVELDSEIQVSGWSQILHEKLKDLVKLASGLDPYIERCTSPHSVQLQSLFESTQDKRWDALHSSGETTIELESEMLSGRVEGKFLQFLVSISKAKAVLEIGMFTGYATLAMAEALPADGKIIACEIEPLIANFGRNFFDQTDCRSKISVRLGSAHETIKQLASENQKFDLVFINAEKSGYTAYLDAILELDLLTKNGYVVVDNTLMQGQPYCGVPTTNGFAVREFNQFVVEHSGLEQVLIPLRDGLTLIRKAPLTGEAVQ